VNIDALQPGDAIYATSHIFNDGGIPEIPEDALLGPWRYGTLRQRRSAARG